MAPAMAQPLANKWQTNGTNTNTIYYSPSQPNLSFFLGCFLERWVKVLNQSSA